MATQFRRRLVIPRAAVAALPSLVTLTGVFAGALLPVHRASAATLTYDANVGTAGIQDGAGAGWNTTASNTNWIDNTNTNVAWPNQIGDTAIFGSGSASGLAAAATVVVGTVNVGTIQFNLASAGGAVGYNLSAGTITLGSGITNNGATGTSTISAKITGTNGLAFVGVAGSSVNTSVTGANDYTGLTTLSTGGRLVAGNNAAFGASTGATASSLGTDYTTVNAGATVVVNGGLAAFNEALVLNGTGSASAGALRVNGVNTLNSLIQLNSSASIVFNGSNGNTLNGNIAMGANTLTVSGGSTTVANTFNGVISGTAGITFNNNGQIDFLTNANNYSGITSNGANTLGIGNNAALGTSTLLFAGGGLQSTDATPRTIANPVTFNANIGAVFGPITGQSGAVGTGALSFTDTTIISLGSTQHGVVTNVETTFNAGFTGTGGQITKTGSAALILNGISNHTGTTNINAGLLGGTGTLSSSFITVAAAAAITGGTNGTTGTLSFGNGATINGNYIADLTALASDTLAVTGTLNLNSATDGLTLQGVTGAPSYTLATFTALLGTFDSVIGLPAGYTLQYNATSIMLVNPSAIPEPATLCVIAAGASAMIRRRRHA